MIGILNIHTIKMYYFIIGTSQTFKLFKFVTIVENLFLSISVVIIGIPLQNMFNW